MTIRNNTPADREAQQVRWRPPDKRTDAKPKAIALAQIAEAQGGKRS